MVEWKKILKKLDDYRWELPKDYKQGMRVPGLIFADEAMIDKIVKDQSLEQVANVAWLPGIVYASLGMPDIHWGYGFAVGGVAATDVNKEGVISPGGVGFDINCGVRLLRTDLTEADVRPRLEDLVNAFFSNIPTGVGSKGKILVQSDKEMDEVLTSGARWAVKRGMGVPEDLDVTEENGCLGGANADAVSKRARERGEAQLGTLGSGNHFLEVDVVEEIFDSKLASVLGLKGEGQVTVLMHCGSRGFGHQVCDDYLRVVDQAMLKYHIQVPDRQLACVPVQSEEGQRYLGAMRAAANFAWANRQCITHWVRESFQSVFSKSWQEIGIRQVYDVCHNVAKIERHTVDGKQLTLCVHRKGATRSFAAGSSDIPARYRDIGQPVLIPGDMGRYSFVAVGAPSAMKLSFGSTCHGAGRAQSRGGAKRLLKGRDIRQELKEQGIIVRAHGGWESLAEEASVAYKDVADVVEVCHNAGLCTKVAKLRPMGVIKG